MSAKEKRDSGGQIGAAVVDNDLVALVERRRRRAGLGVELHLADQALGRAAGDLEGDRVAVAGLVLERVL